MKGTQTRDEDGVLSDGSENTFQISTPWDDLFPHVTEPDARYYLDAIRIYLGLYAGTLSFDDAVSSVEMLKKNPEFVRFPTDPTLAPLNEAIKDKVVDNLKSLKKYGLGSKESLRSAYNFAFLSEPRPLRPFDRKALEYWIQNPQDTLVKASKDLGVMPRTVSNSLQRLRNYNSIRFSCIMDPTAFNMESYMVFFTLQSDTNWDEVETAFANYPFTRAILKTTMSELGYVSLIIPGSENESLFRRSVNALKQEYLDYVSIHRQRAVYQTYNLNLFQDNQWSIPDLKGLFDVETQSDGQVTSAVLLHNQGPRKNVGPTEYVLANQLRINSREQPSRISEILGIQGYAIDTKEVSSTSKKLYAQDILAPVVYFTGIDLTANLCFEIVCNEEWIERLKRRVVLIPNTNCFISQKGIIVIAQVPSYHQVEYYQLFASLLNQNGVDHVQPIMTIRMRGSRIMPELVRYWNYDLNAWSVPREDIDITGYFEDIN